MNNITLQDLSDFHKVKFGKVPEWKQLAKIIEEFEEANNAYTLDEMLKELSDLMLAIVGFYNSYDADINKYMSECVEKVRNRNYPDNFKHQD